MSLARGISAIVLAGDRGPHDPVALATGAPCKALSPAHGIPMLLRVLDTLDDRGDIEQILICGPKRDIVESHAGLQRRLAENPRLHWIQPAHSPASSAAAALDAISAEEPCFVTTADHALLSPELLAEFLDQALLRREDVVVGLAPLSVVHEAFPGSRRTAFRLRDDAYCGCNLFLMRTARGRRAAAFWQRVESLRKKPWRIARVFGPKALLGLLTRRLTLAGALKLVGKKIGLTASAVILKSAELAVDVDSVEDLQLVDSILARRENGTR